MNEIGAKRLVSAIVLLLMTCNTAGYALLVQHTLNRVDASRYYSTTVVLCTEILKLSVSVFMALREHQWKVSRFVRKLWLYFTGNHKYHGMKLGVPAFIYAVQNNLVFIGLANLSAATFQITYQLKIIMTAVFMVVFLDKKFSVIQWTALFMLFLGVILVQLESQSAVKPLAIPTIPSTTTMSVVPPPLVTARNRSQILGFAVVLLSSVTSGFAGVYFELILKKIVANFWITSTFMYIWGTLFSFILVLYHDLEHVKCDGMFHGYTAGVIGIIVMSGIGGLLSSIVVYKMDNICKSFASSLAVVLTSAGSYCLLRDGPTFGANFCTGAFLVCLSTVLFCLS